MILIAESGATKTDWRLLHADGTIGQAKTEGFNPYHLQSDQIQNRIRENLVPLTGEAQVEKIFFYGAGCASEGPRSRIIDALTPLFTAASIEVESDLLAAARALCGHEEGIACILGTGANSCYYDGTVVVDNVPPLGFIIADEGSGADLGKCIVADYFRQDMPEDLRQKFYEKYQMDRPALLDKVYNQEKPGRFLADFTRFISENISEDYIHDLLYSRFRVFLEKNVCKYDNHQDLKVHFTGGVVFHFNAILREVAREMAITVGRIIENPIAGLTIFHSQA